MKVDSLPSGAWQSLFPRALALIDDISRYGGIANPFWTLGGGTVLMFRYRHRLSKDIDIFVPDPQYLGFVTPRLSDTAADMTEDYTEQPGMFVKLQLGSSQKTENKARYACVEAGTQRYDFGGHGYLVQGRVHPYRLDVCQRAIGPPGAPAPPLCQYDLRHLPLII